MTATPLLDDPHGRKYRRVVQTHSGAFSDVMAVLSDPRYQDRMEHESENGRPALGGAVTAIEALPRVHALLSEPSADADRFKQAVGVAVRLVMESLGWSTSGRKGSLARSRWFTKAERYERRGVGIAVEEVAASVVDAHRDPEYAERVRTGLDRIARMGTPEEHAETYKVLMTALADTRAEEGRPF